MELATIRVESPHGWPHVALRWWTNKANPWILGPESSERSKPAKPTSCHTLFTKIGDLQLSDLHHA